MLVALSLMLLAQVEAPREPPHSHHIRENRRLGRSWMGSQYAYFEAFPASGAGTTGVCNTTAPTGATGQALTLPRASTATCTKGGAGLRTTGIADGDLVVMGSGVPRQMVGGDGLLGLLFEKSATNLLLRFIAIDNAAWSDVGTPSLTTGLADPFGGTAAVSIDDNDGAAFEGRSQAVTVSAGAAHTMSCYVKAGTRAEARITLDGTAATLTGLSATTWSIISVTDASSSGTSITAQVLSGDATGDTGTVIFGGCQVETGSYFTSINPTAGTTTTRAVDGGLSAAVAANSASGSVSLTVTPSWSSGAGPVSTVTYGARYDATSLFYFNTLISAWRINDGTTDCTNPSGVLTARTATRVWGAWSGSTMDVNDGVDTTQCAFDGQWGSPPLTTLLVSTAAGHALDGIITGYCFDTTRARCR